MQPHHAMGQVNAKVVVLLAALAGAGVFFSAATATAHKATVFAWVEGDTVHTESSFSGGREVKNARIEVYDTQGNRLLEGRTDQRGKFSFKIPEKTALKIVLMAGMGHRGEWTVPLEEVAPGMPPPASDASPSPGGPAPPAQKASPPADAAMSPEAIQAAVERALDKKLRPILTLLTQSRRQGPTATDIFSGIGYIFGLVGVGAYVRYRNKKNDP